MAGILVVGFCVCCLDNKRLKCWKALVKTIKKPHRHVRARALGWLSAAPALISEPDARHDEFGTTWAGQHVCHVARLADDDVRRRLRLDERLGHELAARGSG